MAYHAPLPQVRPGRKQDRMTYTYVGQPEANDEAEARRWLNVAQRCESELTAGIAMIGIGYALLAIAEKLNRKGDSE
jgi:hypothetical protein